MTFLVHRAERADVLATALAEIFREPLADPFEAEVVAVHSKGVERWLSHQLAMELGTSPGHADGVSANLDFRFPGDLVSDALAAATGIDPAEDPWRPERLCWPLLEVIETALDEPWLAQLARHLGRAAGDAPDHPDRDRRLAVVRHLADLFDRYGVHRPAMVRAWAAGDHQDGGGGPLGADLAWQAELWRRLRAAMSVPSPAERLAVGCETIAAEPGLVALPQRVVLFGLTRLPASYVDVLRAVAVERDVHVMALHPSHAAWAAVAGSAESGERAGSAGLAVNHPLLRSWGRDSREMQLVLQQRIDPEADPNSLVDPAVIERHHPLPATEPVTLLARLQAAIRADQPLPLPGERPPLAPEDRSVQVHACHGRARQAEVVREAITHLFAADHSLEPRDVVVLCPDIDELAPLLHAAFDDVAVKGGAASGATPPPAIPYRLADRSLRETNPVLGALAVLLDIVDGRLTASEVLGFAALAPVRHRFRLDDDDLERIADWVEATGTRWGLDAAHREPYDLATVGAGTWEAGITRLLLGIVMTEDDDRLVGGALPLDDVDSGDIDLAGRLAELIGRLGTTVRELCEPRTIGAWIESLHGAADRLFATRAADAWQRSQLDRLLEETAVEAGVGPDAGTDADPTLRLAEIRDLLADRLKGKPSRAAFRTGDMTMCTLVPMRSVPHRVVCIVGLDDGAFPRAGSPDGDDLLVQTRQIGDHDRRSEDRQLLLDAVLAAGDALVITYAGRDVRTNEVLPPAVPVNELLDVIDASVSVADGAARNVVVRHHPLQPSHPRNFEAGALAAGPWSFDPDQLAGARASLAPAVAPPPFLSARLAPPPPTTVIALADLVTFVNHPVRAFLRQRLDLSLRSYDDSPGDSLTVEMDALQQWSVGDRFLEGVLAGRDPEALAQAELARGLLPPGVLGQRVLATARSRAVAIAAAAERVAFGAARRGSRSTSSCPTAAASSAPCPTWWPR